MGGYLSCKVNLSLDTNPKKIYWLQTLSTQRLVSNLEPKSQILQSKNLAKYAIKIEGRVLILRNRLKSAHRSQTDMLIKVPVTHDWY